MNILFFYFFLATNLQETSRATAGCVPMRISEVFDKKFPHQFCANCYIESKDSQLSTKHLSAIKGIIFS